MTGERIQKPWGIQIHGHREPLYHTDLIEVVAGGYCSVQRHNGKANVFHVLSGRLYVKQFSANGGSLAAAHVMPGYSFVVPQGIWHQFFAHGEVKALEVYLPGSEGLLAPDDIERMPALAVGGIANYGELAALWREAFRIEETYVGR